MDDDGRIPYDDGEEELFPFIGVPDNATVSQRLYTAFIACDHGDECPLCEAGTVSLSDLGVLTCRGECGYDHVRIDAGPKPWPRPKPEEMHVDY